MKYAFALVSLSVLALAACSDADENKSMEEVVAATAEMEKPLPGQYSSAMELTELSIPGQPDSVTDQMMGMMAGQFKSTSSSCLTQEAIDEGYEAQFRKLGEGANGMQCDFQKFEVSGNDVDAKLTCTGQGGIVANLTMVGAMGVESQTVDMDMQMSGPQIPGGEMSLKLKVVSERTGDCT